MKQFDRVLQRWRIRQAAKQLPSGLRLIDVGAYQGELFDYLGGRLISGFGIDPLLPGRREAARYVIESGHFPAVRPREAGWDAITMLAVLEHIPSSEQTVVAEACHGLLRPGGRVVITVPSRAVDGILRVLKWLCVIDGMSLEEHHGFDPAATGEIFAPPRFRLLHHSRFQFGLNHLYVFEALPGPRPFAPPAAAATDSR